MRTFRRCSLALFLTWLILASARTEYRPTALDLALAPYRYSLFGWELSHLPDKWLHKLDGALTWWQRPASADELAWAREYFSLAQRSGQLTRSLRAGSLSPEQVQQTQQELDSLDQRQQRLRPFVEQNIEGAVTNTLAQKGMIGWWGGVFPPVDAAFSGTPNILVTSPRERIERQWAILLSPNMQDQQMEQVEAEVRNGRGLSAIVEATGGVASYPSVVSDAYGLHNAVVTVAHEWVHHWLAFHPLGQGFNQSPEMTTLNETVATIVGEEIGDQAFAVLTGQPVNRTPSEARPPAPGTFDFNAAMRETRLGAEALLAQGKVDEAEAYMEQRRLYLVEQGYIIRKINQAYFAFHGSYATTPGSVSPIGRQLRDLRERSGSVKQFLDTVAGFGSYGAYEEYVGGEVPRP